MQTSLARRRRHRRNGGRRGSGGVASKVAIALPLFLFATFVLLGIVGASAAIAGYGYYSQGLEDPRKLLEGIDFAEETVVYDRTGKIELARFGQVKRDVVQYDQIPPWLIDATTSIEDKTFWENAGFDPIGIVSAAIDTAQGNERGASTITQQLVRARLLPPSAFAGTRYERKIREIIQSIRLTQEYQGTSGKEAIMTAYLNQNFYGNRSYGISAAAKSYFGIDDLSKLTLAQAAVLAAIPQSPTSYDLIKNAEELCTVTVAAGADCPAGKTELRVDPSSAIYERRNKVLDLMQSRLPLPLTKNTFAPADFEAAKKEDIVLNPPAAANWLAPHFVWQVRHQLGSILCGADLADTCEKVDTGGYKITTTLDWGLQKKAEKWVKAAAIAPNRKDTAGYLKSINVSYAQWIRNLRGRGIYNAALGAVDYRTGEIMAYVGSGSYYEKPHGKKFQPQFDVLGDGWRQAGSAFKPINYLTAIEDHTLTAASLFMDVVTNFGGGYAPGDADLHERGPLRMRQAIQMSLNIPAIKAALISGPDHVWEFAKKMGIQWQSNKNPAGGSIGIGTVELHYIDLISAYGAIADGGVLQPRTAILSVEDGSGKVVWSDRKDGPAARQVISPQGAYIMQDILQSNTDPHSNPWWAERAIYSGGRRRPAALKTGTTNQEIDLAAMGFVAAPKDPNAPALVVGAWMGNSDNSAPPNGTVALETAASLWQAFLQDATRGTPIAQFTNKPKGLTQVAVDANSGMLPGPFTRRTFKEWFINGTVPKQVDDTKVGIAIDKATGLLWQDGCLGPQVTKGVMDLSGVDAGWPAWQKADRGWAARAARGVGVRGGPKGTPTAYFGFGSYFPFGATWGAPFAPTKKCPIGGPEPSPTPPPSESPFPTGSLPVYPAPTKTPKPRSRRAYPVRV
jgi:membrane peptidoglycan carboxypeptidase